MRTSDEQATASIASASTGAKPKASTIDARNAASMTVEEFDRLQGDHRFSERYEARKRALIAEVASGDLEAVSAPRRISWKVALVAAAALIALPVTAWAVIDNSGFFTGAFGSDGRMSVQSHDEIQDYKEGVPVNVTYPTREYVDVDQTEAERLIGAYVANEPQEFELGDHKMTLLSTVRDGDTMVAHYTLEREGGVTALQWDETTNQAKGARVSENAAFQTWFEAGIAPVMKAEYDEFMSEVSEETRERIANEYDYGEQIANYGSGYILVDPERSTTDRLYCYEYVIFHEAITPGTPVTLRARFADESTQSFDVKTKEALPYREIAGPDGTSVRVSALGMSIYGMDEIDQDAIRDITVAYRDGTTYTVMSGDPYVVNTSNVLFGRETTGEGENSTVYTLLFNRLVDPEAVASITMSGREVAPITFE